MSHSRQTVSYLRARMREVGLQPDKRHGQNFLIDLNLIELIARSRQVPEPEPVVKSLLQPVPGCCDG